MIGGDLRADAGRISRATDASCRSRGPHDAVDGRHLPAHRRPQAGRHPAQSVARARTSPCPRSRAGGAAGSFVDGAAERRAVADASERFGVVARSLEAPIRTLSGGNQQKALLARWHLADADVFVLIEPTRGVDVGARAEIYRRLDALAARRQGDHRRLVRHPGGAGARRSHPRRARRRDRRRDDARREIDEERLNLLVQGAQ